MTINETIRSQWSKRCQYGDVKDISRKLKISQVTVIRAIRYGRCSRKTYDKINSYFIQRDNLDKLITKALETE